MELFTGCTGINLFKEEYYNDLTARIQKFIVCYSGRIHNSGVPAFIAQHFDLASINNDAAGQATWIKANAVNPNIKIIGYYDCMFSTNASWGPVNWQEINTHDDWFVHDKNGCRISCSEYPTSRLMNVGNAGWQNFYATHQCLGQVTGNNSVYDGVLIDDCNYNFGSYHYVSYPSLVPVSHTDFKDDVNKNWNGWMEQHLTNIRKIIPTNKLLLGNSINIPLYQKLGAGEWEGFAHASWETYNDNGRDPSSIQKAINFLHTQAALGNIIAVNSGCADAYWHPTEAKQWMLFCYACFSFAVKDPNKAYFSWQSYQNNSINGYYPEMDIVLGQPLDEYILILDDGQVCARNFSNYYVIANINPLGTGNATFTLPYNRLQYTLPPRQALFIQK